MASAVDIKLVMEPPWTPDRMTEDARDQLGIFWNCGSISDCGLRMAD